MKKIFVCVVCVLACITLCLTASAEFAFTDVSEEVWYYNAVKYVYENNVMVGITETEFEPDTPTNRAMVVAVLARLAGADFEGCDSTDFEDVDVDAWYGKSVVWAQKNGIVAGMSATEFAPFQNITREQMCVMLSKYLDYIDIATPAPDVQAFSDVDKISAWAVDDVVRLQKAGIVNGKDNNVFDPQGVATRAEIAQIVRSSNLADIKPENKETSEQNDKTKNINSEQ